MLRFSKVQVKKDHYFNLNYDKKERWISYWYQINEVVKKNPESVLEIGVGNRTVSDYLKKAGIKVTTCDFDTSLKPDVLADVLKLPFKEKCFDVVLCAEVLEHLPFNKFKKALFEIKRVCKLYSIITLPHYSLTNFYLGIKLIPYIKRLELSLKVDFPFQHKFEGEHHWEIGKKSFPLKKIEVDIEKTGFRIEKSYYPKENPRHHFFILKK